MKSGSETGTLNSDDERSSSHTEETTPVSAPHGAKAKAKPKAKLTVTAKEVRTNRKGSLVLAILACQKPFEQHRTKFLIPKGSAAWLDHLIHLASCRRSVQYLSDKELENMIRRWRTTVVPLKQIAQVNDRDLPLCYHWTREQVGEWVETVSGYPQYKVIARGT